LELEQEYDISAYSQSHNISISKIQNRDARSPQ
jgi:hypothetical protein